MPPHNVARAAPEQIGNGGPQLSSYGGVDLQANIPKQGPAQAVGFQVLHGFGSATALHDVAEVTGERYLEILYIGDFDPSGMHMSEVDLPGRVEKYGGVVDITRIALTRTDCTDVLPSFSVETKSRDPRYTWFKRNYGGRCWELDAMNPVDLRWRLRNEIIQRIDMDAWAHCETVEVAERESLNQVYQSMGKGMSIFERDQKYSKPHDRAIDWDGP